MENCDWFWDIAIYRLDTVVWRHKWARDSICKKFQSIYAASTQSVGCVCVCDQHSDFERALLMSTNAKCLGLIQMDRFRCTGRAQKRPPVNFHTKDNGCKMKINRLVQYYHIVIDSLLCHTFLPFVLASFTAAFFSLSLCFVLFYFKFVDLFTIIHGVENYIVRKEENKYTTQHWI